ncbi:MAG TPA: DUF898 family protein [Pseudolabrys sp.]|jgi:uncharacterized membrane protein YjgN (DUF898 family)|nr:DUF898 family protein [Pseudolabrys sp.]
MTSTDVSAPATTGGVRFLGSRSAYFQLLVRGALLLMVTLGIYRFWLATDVRRFLWSNTEVAGESLEYTGTPFELLIGFLAAIAILIPVYAVFFLAALDLGVVGQFSSLFGFALLALLGQYAVYRARRYRLTRTIFRGLRFHQSGSAWRYAICALFWWSITILTCGLAYPWQQERLERFKMRNTYYGDLAGSFEGSAFRLFLRGLPMWLLVVGPLIAAIGALIEAVDWTALANVAEQGGDDMMARLEGASPGFGGAVVFAILMASLTVFAAAILYPAFQAVVLRWWMSGLRFGEIEVSSRLKTRHVYGAYFRFLWWALLFSLGTSLFAAPVALIVAKIAGSDSASMRREIVTSGALLIGYVIVALGYSAIYRATVKLSLWQLGAESLQLSGLAALDKVKSTGRPSSALGEGLADALNVGGY